MLDYFCIGADRFLCIGLEAMHVNGVTWQLCFLSLHLGGERLSIDRPWHGSSMQQRIAKVADCCSSKQLEQPNMSST